MISTSLKRSIAEAAAHHAKSKTYSGSLAMPHRHDIARVIFELGVKSVLDYGAGKGEQYMGMDPLHAWWPADVALTLYDPCLPEFSEKPTGRFDLVICTHVLGSVTRRDLPAVLDEIYGFAAKAIYFGELIGPVKKRIFSQDVLGYEGLSRAAWEDLLFRKDAGLDVVIGFRYPDSEEISVTTLSEWAAR